MPRLLLITAFLAACTGGVHPIGGGGGDSAGGSGPPQELCDNHLDDDGNGLSDCADPACAATPACPVCGDGVRNSGEVCEGGDLGTQTCLTLGFNSGGFLRCTSACAFDTSGCKRHEDCQTAGDEDQNGLPDCADPACSQLSGCLSIARLEAPVSPLAFSWATLGFLVTDGAQQALGGGFVTLTGPQQAVVPQVPLPVGVNGVVRFRVRLGRAGVSETFTASLAGTAATTSVELEPVDPPRGTIRTVLDADRLGGTDSSGPAVAAHVGSPLDLQVATDGTIYVAEACRVVVIAPDGTLSRLAGTGVCGLAPADVDSPGDVDLSVSGIALDEAKGLLYLSDGLTGLVRSLDLQRHVMHAVAGGGSLTGAAGYGGPANAMRLQPAGVALDPAGRLIIRDVLGATFLAVDLDTGIVSLAMPSVAYCSTCGEPCRMTWDAGGSAFITGTLTNVTNSPYGVARYDDSRQLCWLPLAGNYLGRPPSGVVATAAQFPPIRGSAFDAAGNLFLAAGNGIYRIDGTTAVVDQVAGGEAGFVGENQAATLALFDSPSALAFGPGGDLYVADTGNGTVRQITGIGATTPTTASVEAVSGDGQTGLLASTLAAPLRFRVKDAAGRALAGEATRLVPDQPGVFPHFSPPTDAAGEADGMVRLGLPPGPVTVRVYLQGIHQTPAGTPAVFSATEVEPPSGTIFGANNLEYQLEPLPGSPVAAPAARASIQRVRIDADGTLFGSGGTRVVRLDSQGLLSVVAGNGNYPGQGLDGLAVEAAFVPVDLVLDQRSGLIDVADSAMVRSVDQVTGLLSALAGPGSGEPGHGDDGPARDATFGALESIEREKDGTLDLGSDDPVGLRRIDPATGIIRSVLPGGPCTGAADGLREGVQSLRKVGNVLWMGATVCHRGSTRPSSGLLALFGDGTVRTYDVEALSIEPALIGGALLLGGSGVIRHFDPFNGAVSDFITSTPTMQLYSVTGLAYDPAGHLWFADGNLRVLW